MRGAKEYLKETFIVGVGGLMGITAFITAPALIDYIANGYAAENYGDKWFICLLGSLGFFAIAFAWGETSSLKARIVAQVGDPLLKNLLLKEEHSPADLKINKSISFNEPGFKKNELTNTQSDSEYKSK